MRIYVFVESGEIGKTFPRTDHKPDHRGRYVAIVQFPSRTGAVTEPFVKQRIYKKYIHADRPNIRNLDEQ